MIGVYVSIRALNNMAFQDRWIKILKEKKFVQIYVYASDEVIMEYAQSEVSSSPIANLILAVDITIKSEIQVIDQIKSDYSKVLEYPTSVFFLDIPEQDAQRIQDNYGVICKNENKVDGTELSSTKEIVSCKGEQEHSWSEFLKEIKKMPTNSIIVSDRYLFANDCPPTEKPESREGRDNLISIIDSILPQTFSSDYHILILYSHKNKDSECKLKFNKLSKEIYEKIKEKRSYEICVEIISVSCNNRFYEETHNRRIITNYHVIRTEHKTNAFKGDISNCSQVLNWDMVFSKGVVDNSDMPVKTHTILINSLKDISNYGSTHISTCGYLYSINGVSLKDDNYNILFEEITNRLIKDRKNK